MSVKDNPNLEFEQVFNGRQEQGSTEVPSDQKAMAGSRAEANIAPQGTPPADFTVRSVYDSRPVNAVDINPIASFGPGEGGLVSPGQNVLTVFIVPQNFVCVPRAWHHWFTPLPAGIARDDVLLSLRVNGGDVPFNSAIPIGEESDELVRSFFVVPEFATVEVMVELLIALPALSTFFIHMYGNLLQKTGVPSQFEIANVGGRMARQPQPSIIPRSIPAPEIPMEALAPAPQLPAPVSMPQCPPGTVWDPERNQCMRPRGTLSQAKRR